MASVRMGLLTYDILKGGQGRVTGRLAVSPLPLRRNAHVLRACGQQGVET